MRYRYQITQPTHPGLLSQRKETRHRIQNLSIKQSFLELEPGLLGRVALSNSVIPVLRDVLHTTQSGESELMKCEALELSLSLSHEMQPIQH